MRHTAPENPPLTGQLRSFFEKPHGIGGTKLHPNGRCQPLRAIGGKVAVEIVEPGFKRYDRNAQRFASLGQGRQCRCPGWIIIARDIEAAQRSRELDGSEMGGR